PPFASRRYSDLTDATSLNVQWNAVSGATQYQVYFGSSAANLSLYTTVNAPTVMAAFYNLNGGATYYWKVVAVAGSNSAGSAVWSFTTPGGSQTSPPPIVLSRPSGSTTRATGWKVPRRAVAGAARDQAYLGPAGGS